MRNPAGLIVRWAGPILAGSTIFAMFACAMLVRAHRHAVLTEDPLVQAMGVPAALVPWVNTGEKPTTGELLEIAEE